MPQTAKESPMLCNTNNLKGFVIQGLDGEIGHINDLYFDDDAWVVRYFVAETRSLLSSRKVLLSPMALQEPHWEDRMLKVSLTQGQAQGSPAVDFGQPVTREQEAQYLAYSGLHAYWDGHGLWGDSMYPFNVVPDYIASRADWTARQREDALSLRTEGARKRSASPHLRSCEAVLGYHVHTRDGDSGHIADILVDDVTWAIRYLVVDTSNWWTSHKVLIAPAWISALHWDSETVSTDLSRDAIYSSPAFDPNAVLDRAWELRLHEHYSRLGYWTRDEALEGPH
jgi:uncharacterized protein YrrD